LFLDEIGNLPLAGQAKTTCASCRPANTNALGSNTTPARENVRIVAATNLPLRDAMREGRFREDLYLPHQRPSSSICRRSPSGRDDVLPLTRRFSFCRPGARLGGDAGAARLLSYFLARENVRELRNVLQRAALLAGDNPISAGHAEPARRVARRVSDEPVLDQRRPSIGVLARETPTSWPRPRAQLGMSRQAPLSPHGKNSVSRNLRGASLNRAGIRRPTCAGVVFFHGRPGDAVARRQSRPLGVLVAIALQSFIDIPRGSSHCCPRWRSPPAVAFPRAQRLTDHWSRHGARALNDGVLSIKDRDFSVQRHARDQR